mgnify:CR=1 FL=1
MSTGLTFVNAAVYLHSHADGPLVVAVGDKSHSRCHDGGTQDRLFGRISVGVPFQEL